MNNKGKERCRTCKYYIEHYIKQEARIISIGGHCINNELNKKRVRNKFALQENCEYWEDNATVKVKRKERIADVLKDMRNRLEQIQIILEEDK